MKLNPWPAPARFHRLPLAQQLELLLIRRQMLKESQQELLGRQTALARQRHELLERQTAQHLQSRLFWAELRQAALVRQREEAEITSASARPAPLEVPREFPC